MNSGTIAFPSCSTTVSCRIKAALARYPGTEIIFTVTAQQFEEHIASLAQQGLPQRDPGSGVHVLNQARHCQNGPS